MLAPWIISSLMEQLFVSSLDDPLLAPWINPCWLLTPCWLRGLSAPWGLARIVLIDVVWERIANGILGEHILFVNSSCFFLVLMRVEGD